MATMSLHGEWFEVPVPLGEGQYAGDTRVRLLMDGVANCIRHTPPSERALATNLQYAWMQLAAMRKAAAKPPPQGVFECLQ